MKIDARAARHLRLVLDSLSDAENDAEGLLKHITSRAMYGQPMSNGASVGDWFGTLLTNIRSAKERVHLLADVGDE